MEQRILIIYEKYIMKNKFPVHEMSINIKEIDIKQNSAI